MQCADRALQESGIQLDSQRMEHHEVEICVEAFFLSPKMQRSVTTKILLPDMFLRYDTNSTGNYGKLSDFVFVRQHAKKGIALHDGVRSSMVFSSDSRASKDAN